MTQGVHDVQKEGRRDSGEFGTDRIGCVSFMVSGTNIEKDAVTV